MKAWVANIGLLLFSLGAAFAVAEVALRWVEKKAAPGESQVALVYDPRIGWRHPSGRRVLISTPEYRVWVTYNTHGVRGPEIQFEKPRGTRRVLLLGDSFAEGYSVDDSDVVSAALKRSLSESGSAAYQVINAGVAGYSTDQEYLLYREQTWRYHPDVTILLFYVNDVWFNNRARYWRGWKPQFKLEHGRLRLSGVPVPRAGTSNSAIIPAEERGAGGVLHRTDRWFELNSAVYRNARKGLLASPISGWLVKGGLAGVPDEFLPWRRMPDAALQEAWCITEAILVELRDRVERDGGAFLIMHVPSRPAVYPDEWRAVRRRYAMNDAEWSPSQEAEVLAEVCRRRGLHCVFPLERFRREAARHPDQRLYFRRDGHWTPAGHRLAAAILADTIRGVLNDRALHSTSHRRRPAPCLGKTG